MQEKQLDNSKIISTIKDLLLKINIDQVSKKEKNALIMIMNSILDKIELNDIKLEKEHNSRVIINENIPNDKKFVLCKNCNCKLLEKNIDKHNKKCTPILKKKNLPIKKKNKLRVNFSVKNLFDDKQEERRLDGSRDYYQFRENGRFGSHSVFDDMEDGSFS